LLQVPQGADGNATLEIGQQWKPSWSQLGFMGGVLVLELWVSPLAERCGPQRGRE